MGDGSPIYLPQLPYMPHPNASQQFPVARYKHFNSR